MESRITFLGHPLHAMLCVMPLGLLFGAFLFDVIYLWRQDPFWRRGAFWLIVFGTAAAVPVIASGVLDYLAIPMPPEPRRIATRHLFLGSGLLLAYGIQIALRWKDAGPVHPARRYPAALFLYTLLCTGGVAAQGWLGGELSHIHGIGVKLPPAPASRVAGEPVSGQQVYRRVCAGCHGENGQGEVGPRLARPARPRTVEEIERIVTAGRPPLMPAFRTQLTPEEIRAVSAFTHALMTGEASGAPRSGGERRSPSGH